MSVVECAFYLVHVFATISWLGAMYFNLVLIFPSYRAGAKDIQQERRMYQVQGTRAAYWLYAFIIFTFSSGIFLAVVQERSVLDSFLVIKISLLAVMAACHLIGSYFIWPRIMFSLGDEVRRYLNRYQFTMLVSAALGSLVVVITYVEHLAK